MPIIDDEYIKKATTLVVFAVLLVLTFFLLKPLLLSIVFGLILAFVFTPLHNSIKKVIKSKNLSVFLICLLFAAAIIVPVWFLTPIVIEQSFKIFQASQQLDVVTPLKKFFPSLFASDIFSNEVGNVLQSFIEKSTNYVFDLFAGIILHFPVLVLQLLVVSFTFFFTLRDKESIIKYIQSLMPFSKEVEKKLFEQSRMITSSVIYGQIFVGVIQGILTGTGFFIAQVPNAMFLTLIAMLASIMPMIGPVFVWVPVFVYLLVAGNVFAALIVVIFGLIASTIDNLLKPIIVSRTTRMHSAIVLIGMIGGLFMFGVLGLIIGPLILAYLLIILEIYRKKQLPGVFIEAHPNK